MSLNPRMLWSVVHLSNLGGPVLGSGFAVSVPSTGIPGYRWTYLVTADHVVAGYETMEVAAPDPMTGEMREPFELDGWHAPLKDIDLSIAPMPEQPPGARPQMQDIRLESEAIEGTDIYHGAEIFYIGVFVRAKTTMVRGGTLGALDVPIKKTKLGREYAYPAHLVDCRSYEGFSGSPCFLREEYPLSAEPVPLPDNPAIEMGGPLQMAYVSKLCGVFTAHYDNEQDPAASLYGVGVMLPARHIIEALMSDEQIKDRMRRDQARKAAEPPPIEPTDVSHEPSEFERFENLTRKLVNTPKPTKD